ncbi:MAG: Aspartyl/glutamyl-tRNA(Asn/Gln) amidotransferase subunit C [Microgenomates group bacterium GW2011_GWA2_44_7]|uniref:Aspartyl/glutamyl-tRNA(Asn/Gln) amidotransferase subunit C n=1 Tax=Candidatus Woesebacteria bacterium GW2011_GWA1_43_12 TaxID=1618557 RepID=A0A0G1CYM1_9BACT|nr:MAG: Aspartyl/glutamyl-tRNA(Asn/Gln) amidotransferase subunit C [Candidatus Woesebacteria bacterium GW2011_GWA1_43_12]KKT75888.1 MAG: Aspartyl/glutamyl-tRNA(Asn/Gln) amidotransferase subunit C [Microgenomates group bacterium GW2011_GWA2_44_7]KKT78492.1 MAG: Aspartyl/glutamyl-tRNA(Asn/Gln) amidotransferase subunit C [Microgenomates group bacterium GW2011_GWB1_44_8]
MKGRNHRSDIVAKKVKLTREEVLHIAKLAQLELSEEEVIKFQDQLSSVLEYVSQLQAVKTEGVPETSQVTGLESIYREDKVNLGRCLSVTEVLSNAPASQENFVKVKAVKKAK